jgi:hypothetical protein
MRPPRSPRRACASAQRRRLLLGARRLDARRLDRAGAVVRALNAEKSPR